MSFDLLHTGMRYQAGRLKIIVNDPLYDYENQRGQRNNTGNLQQ